MVETCQVMERVLDTRARISASLKTLRMQQYIARVVNTPEHIPRTPKNKVPFVCKVHARYMYAEIRSQENFDPDW